MEPSAGLFLEVEGSLVIPSPEDSIGVGEGHVFDRIYKKIPGGRGRGLSGPIHGPLEFIHFTSESDCAKKRFHLFDRFRKRDFDLRITVISVQHRYQADRIFGAHRQCFLQTGRDTFFRRLGRSGDRLLRAFDDPVEGELRLCGFGVEHYRQKDCKQQFNPCCGHPPYPPDVHEYAIR